jgi:hypothetical protein
MLRTLLFSSVGQSINKDIVLIMKLSPNYFYLKMYFSSHALPPAQGRHILPVH